jgi:transposase
MIPAVIERCAGIDIGKKLIVACVMTGAAEAEGEFEIREFGSIVAELKRLRDWLRERGCTHAAMESTGSYWKPVFNVLEDSVKVVLAQPEQVKARKGHKTDRKDSWWLAHLLRHGMIRSSFIPPRAIRELRDLTRRRKKMIQAGVSEKNRVEKVLEDANIKLSSVLSDLFGVSGQLMLEALLRGSGDAEQIAQFAQRRAKVKIPQIIASLQEHQMSDHHRTLLRFSLDHLRFLEEQVLALDEAIQQKLEAEGLLEPWRLLQSIPGIQGENAAAILAETGADMQQFPSERHVSSWAGVAPGNCKSAGRDLGGRTTKGNRWLRAALTESAWAASHRKEGYLREKFWRIAVQNRKKAVVAVAHNILVLAYSVLRRGTPYEERSDHPAQQRQRTRLIRHHLRRLGKLGIRLPARCHIINLENANPSL